MLRAKGWWGKGVVVDPDTLEARVIQQGSLRRLQTIYRTNLQSAYMAGRLRQAQEQADRAPWAQYLAIRDAKTRPGHAALHGQVFRLDSPAWAVIAPPNGYNCRCRARYLSDRELAARGLKPAQDVRLLEREPPGKRPVNPLTGETPARWLQRGVSVPDPLNPNQRLTLWADPNWEVYAATQQFGRADNRMYNNARGHPAPIPPRPFLPVNPAGELPPAARDEILAILADYLARVCFNPRPAMKPGDSRSSSA